MSARATPAVSFIVPTLNEARTLVRCIAAIRRTATAALPVEVIVMDNGSADDTPALARAHADHLEVHPGKTIAWLRNRGVAVAQGRWLAFVDADCEIDPAWLAHGMARMAGDPSCGAVGSFYTTPPGATWIQRTWSRSHRMASDAVAFLPAGNFLTARDLFLQLQGFNAGLITGEDYDFFLRLRKAGKRVVLHTPMVSWHHEGRMGFGGFLRKEYWYGKGMLETFRQGGLSKPFLAALAHGALVVAAIHQLLQGRWLVGGALLVAIPAASAAYRSARACTLRVLPGLVLLYEGYLLARLASIGWLVGSWALRPRLDRRASLPGGRADG